MLTEDRPIPQVAMTAALRSLIERIRALPRADLEELIDLVQHLHESDDPEESAGLIRAIEELLEQRPVAVRDCRLTDQAMPPVLKRWAEQVGRRIRELRKGAGLNQAELARAAGLTQSHISRLENAEHSATHLTLTKIAGALGVVVGDIDPSTDTPAPTH
ncbi:MAG: helix-turn-helix domain-containing protein [Isosphaeraceae bacterium]